jgi:hypothetical protein
LSGVAALAGQRQVSSLQPADDTCSTDPSVDSDGDGLTDVFEAQYGLNCHSADTNGDGLLDPAEDPDHDGLSNLAEQTLGTNPLDKDSDHDGTPDGMEDSDNNGVVDWKQQDDRPVPQPLTPSLAKANADYVCYRPGVGSTGRCVGDPQGTTRIAIYGDSHAGQWIAGLDKYSKEHHWKLNAIAKSGCPSVHVNPTADPKFNLACRTWRKTSEANFRAKPPALIIISNYSHYGPTPAEWQAGLTKTIQALPRTSHIVVLGDTPRFDRIVPKCLENHPLNLGACEQSRSDALKTKHDNLEKATAIAHGATFITMTPWVCPYELCPVIVGHLLLYRDSNHLTVTYSRQLAEALGALLPADLPR